MQALKPKTNLLHTSTKLKFYETSKNGKPTKRPMTDQTGTPTQCNSSQTSQTGEELKELRIKKLRAEIDFSIDKIVQTLRADVEKFKGGNIKNCFEKLANITQD